MDQSLARRVRQVRVELFGKGGVPRLASAIGLPPATWSNFEAGVVIPGTILLQFIDLTGVHPRWLLSGEGDKFLAPSVP